MSYVLFNPHPPTRRGLPGAFYISRNFGRSDTPGYLSYTDRLDQARRWKTLRGVERFLERNPYLNNKGYEIREVTADV